jgi:hypothetical protein
MAKIALHSGWLAAADYQDSTAVLELELCTGAVYRYAAVPREVFEGLQQAESAGRYFNAQIRNRFTGARRQVAGSGMPEPVPTGWCGRPDTW